MNGGTAVEAAPAFPPRLVLITTSLEEARLQDPFPAKGNMQ